MKTFISFSGGVESTTMCILYGKGATAIFADTGDEFPEMYARWETVFEEIKKLHDGDFNWVAVKGRAKIKGEFYDTLPDAALAWSYYPSAQSRWCTRIFKIEPIDDYLREQGECELLIGFNADENPESDRTGNYMECENVTYRYPLHADGKTRDDCEEILYEYGLHPDFANYMSRGGCVKCFFKSRDELKAMYIQNRPIFMASLYYEKKIQDRRKKFYSINMNVRDGYQGVKDEMDRLIAEQGIEWVTKMYSRPFQAKTCGAFCNR